MMWIDELIKQADDIPHWEFCRLLTIIQWSL